MAIPSTDRKSTSRFGWSLIQTAAAKFIALTAATVCILLIFCQASLADEKSRWPKGSEEMSVSLEVVDAIEDGPVVCKVVLKNVSDATLNYATSMFDRGAFCAGDSGWTAKMEPRFKAFSICGNPGPYHNSLSPGQSTYETFYPHQGYLKMPSGKATIRFGWRVYQTVENSRADALDRQQLQSLYTLEKTRTIDLLPASEKNLRPVLLGLQKQQRELAEKVKGYSDYCWSSADPTDDFVKTLSGCRHREFVPVLIESINFLPASDLRHKLIGTVYDCLSKPEDGFAALAAYLRSEEPTAAGDIFEFWRREDHEHEASNRRQKELKNGAPKEAKPNEFSLETFSWQFAKSEEDAWKTSKRHPDLRLSADQFECLLKMPNVWVRSLLYANYPQKCPPIWVEKLMADLKSTVEPPKQLAKWIAELSHDQYRVREQATAELTKIATMWLPTLENECRQTSSAEARHRLRAMIDRFSKPQLPHLSARTIRHFVENSGPQTDKMLEILIASPHANLYSQSARDAVAERRKRDDEWRRRDEEAKRSQEKR